MIWCKLLFKSVEINQSATILTSNKMEDKFNITKNFPIIMRNKQYHGMLYVPL